MKIFRLPRVFDEKLLYKTKDFYSFYFILQEKIVILQKNN